MKPVRAITGTMLQIDRADVDTDQIIPQQFLKRIERDGYGEFLFHNWAHHDNGELNHEFIINHPHRSDARVLVAGPNFGCGSSREHAAWAIQEITGQTPAIGQPRRKQGEWILRKLAEPATSR